jgi:hypothetical protein
MSLPEDDARDAIEAAMDAYAAIAVGPNCRVSEYATVIQVSNLDDGKNAYLYSFRRNNNLATVEGIVRKLLRWIETRR